MDQFEQKFIEEATDLINELEEILLRFESSSSNSEIVERIFRIIHTIKGASGMFGFSKIDEYTHNLENIFDLIRSGKLEVSPQIIEIAFSSIDHLQELLKGKDVLADDIEKRHKKLLAEINSILNNEEQQENTLINETETKQLKTYYIYFEPIKEILKNGTNPLYIIDELCQLGEAKVILRDKSIPDFSSIDPTMCYLSWEVFLSTELGINSIIDVFMFVEDDSNLEIKKISDLDLLSEKTFVGILNEAIVHENKVNIDEFIELVRELEFIFKGSLDTKKAHKKQTEDEKQVSSIRVASDKLDELMNLVSELVTMQARLMIVAEHQKSPELNSVAEQINKLTRQLRDNAFSLTLLPIETMLTRFQRLVRDLSKELDKNVDFTTEGTDTEIDKSLIQYLIDPILHIIRNCLDHGIENKDDRIKSGKSEVGSIHFNALYSGAYIIIQITDDGKGIDPEILWQKAKEKGIVSDDKVLTNEEKLNLVFKPGFSTSTRVTDVSGRGVGMDVVKRNLQKIGGEVEVESTPGKGTTFTLKIPLTLSIIDGLLVAIDEEKYLIPLSVIDKIYAVPHTKLVNIFNQQITLDGKRIPFYYLRTEFNMEASKFDIEQIIVVRYGNAQIGLAFDRVIGEYQAVLKPLGKMYSHLDIFSGATILGDGTVALVLDTFKIIQRFSLVSQSIQDYAV